MNKSSDLLQEAIADANKVKEIAFENAKAAIAEAFQPKIQRMISTKLAEEEYEEEMPPEMEPETTPEEEYMGEDYVNDGANGTPDNPLKNNGEEQTGLDEESIDEEFDKLIRELESGSDDLQEADDAYDEKVSATKKNIGEMELPMDEPMDDEEEGDDLDNLNLEALIKKLEEEEFGAQAVAPVSRGTSNLSNLQAENARLKNENQQAFQALAAMKSTMNEVNLLNSKLMYSTKIIQSFDLSESQQVKILETFDRANSVREVKLVYTTIHESFSGRAKKNVVAKKAVTESASRTIRTVKGNTTAKDSQLMEGAERWQQIAGLKPLND
jgi:hypothetical protein